MSLGTDGELRQEAEELRKTGKFKESREKYALLWEHSQRVLYGAGLLHCLRKLNDFDEALQLAHELEPHCSELNWCKTEVVWTYITGELTKITEDEPLQKTLDLAEKIMALDPDGTALEVTVFEVLKHAKQKGDWSIIDRWVVKMSPENLSAEPPQLSNGREGWSKQAQWYNYRINSLIETGKNDEAIEIVEDALTKFPKEKKFFIRLKAVACHKVGRIEDARKIYEELCRNPHADWWILHDYARLLKDANEPEHALQVMYKAAVSNSKLEAMVNLFQDIGTLAQDLTRPTESIPHLYLAKFVRERNDWKLPQNLSDQLQKATASSLDAAPPADLKEALAQCRNIWNQHASKKADTRTVAKTNLQGRVNLGNPDRPFCFIRVDGSEDYFCFKSDLPQGTKEGDGVIFDLIPSYDKKKQKDSWRAVNLRALDSNT